MAKVFAPNKAYNGETASVHFASGMGETENSALLDWFREHGYTVEDTSIDREAEKAVTKMTVAELRAYADGKGIDLSELTKKEDILAKIMSGQ